jgi:hypothetical protein
MLVPDTSALFSIRPLTCAVIVVRTFMVCLTERGGEFLHCPEATHERGAGLCAAVRSLQADPSERGRVPLSFLLGSVARTPFRPLRPKQG